jgi:3-deoxy-D-manno-octulosonic-acid transferase
LADVCLGDTTGELSRLVQVADLAYIGKSLFPHSGGQSPLEAAMAGVPVVYGDRMTNFRDICAQIEREGAAVKVAGEREAIRTIVALAGDCPKRKILAKNIGRWFEKNRGASEKTHHFICKNLEQWEGN